MPFPAALTGRRERRIDITRMRPFEAALARFRRVRFDQARPARIAREVGGTNR